ncbi:hypothetical protein ABW19_dt0208451 [Dactylella cylindrospora]|nr:hypothetical protein ABW19_dt0208451 [Dactylella cylindrospora]
MWLTDVLVGPEVGGDYGPYRQSERSHIHKEHALQLLKSGHAYRCFCTVDRLQALAESRAHLGLASEYDRTCEGIPESESAARAEAGEAHVIRLRVPDQYPEFTDLVYGRIKPGMPNRHGQPAYEDPILIKTDGLPTYHLANVVDDHLMQITHVIRGIEWLPSTPKHKYLYNAFGWKPPAFCHVGLLQDIEGKKLSKRSGDVHVAEYAKNGYLPEALVNFVALLGWNNRAKSDILPLKSLVERFNVTDLTKGNTKVNFGKLIYFQKAYIQKYASPEHHEGSRFRLLLIDQIRKALEERFPDTPEGLKSTEYLSEVLESDIKNFVTADKYVDQHDYFFLPTPNFDCTEANIYREKLSGDEVVKGKEALNIMIKSIKRRREKGHDWNEDLIHKIIEDNWEEKEPYKMVIRNLRYALAGGRSGPSINRIMMLLGEEECLKRMREVQWSGKRGQVDDKGRVVMTWKEPPVEPEDDTEDSEGTINDLIRKSGGRREHLKDKIN